MRALFWRSSWIGGAPLSTQFPRLFVQSRRKNKMVCQALTGDSWVRDLGRALPTHLLHDFLGLWRLMRGTSLQDNVQDSISWIVSDKGCYSASSAYRMHFEGHTRSMAPAMIWEPWAPPKIKHFGWLLLHNRLWCADRLQRRQWPNEYFCQLCMRNLETADHLFFDCPFSKQIWDGVAAWPRCQPLAHDTWAGLSEPHVVWSKIVEASPPPLKQGIKSLFMLVCWGIWSERNDRIFRGKSSPRSRIVSSLRDTAREWAFINAKALRKLMFEPP
jgi:hypothetical protein